MLLLILHGVRQQKICVILAQDTWGNPRRRTLLAKPGVQHHAPPIKSSGTCASLADQWRLASDGGGGGSKMIPDHDDHAEDHERNGSNAEEFLHGNLA
jgi:hypothetical protein